MTHDEFDALDRVRADDAAYFTRWPEREFRLRRAFDIEVSGQKPNGFDAFAIVHRQDVGVWHRATHFGAPITFSVERADAEVREILATLALNPHAMLTAADLRK